MSLVPGSAYGNIGASAPLCGSRPSRATAPLPLLLLLRNAALNTLQWMTPLSPASVIFTLTDGAAALADLVAWHSQQRAAGGRAASTALAYVPSTVLPRIDGGRNARVESVDGSRPTLWLTRMYLLQVRPGIMGGKECWCLVCRPLPSPPLPPAWRLCSCSWRSRRTRGWGRAPPTGAASSTSCDACGSPSVACPLLRRAQTRQGTTGGGGGRQY